MINDEDLNARSNILNSINEIGNINQNIQSIARRLNQQNRVGLINSIQEIFTIENYLYLLYSAWFFVLSSLTLAFLIPLLLYNLYKIPEDRIYTLSILESDEMNVNYLILVFILLFSLRSFYLFFVIFIFNCDYANFKWTNSGSIVSVADSFYFNPCCFTVFVWLLQNNFFLTGFDVYSWFSISLIYVINFAFTSRLHFYSNVKISQISNTSLPENYYFIRRMRLHYVFLIIMNVAFSYFLAQLLEESYFSIQYILIFKGIYLFSKQIEYFTINEINFKYLIWGSNIKEETFMRNLSLKSKLQILNMIFILHKIVLASCFVFNSGHNIIFLFPLLLMILHLVFNIVHNYNSYKRICNFYSKLDQLFPKVSIDKEQECIICTENIIDARKLSCNHYFHLICLSKWIEKGNKSCPICRKEIDFHENLNLSNNNTGIWTYGLRLDGRFFSWLPNITFRIIRMNGGNVFNNQTNLIPNSDPLQNN